MRKLFGNSVTVIVVLLLIIAALATQILYSRVGRVLPDVALHFLKDVTLPQQGERVLVFSPHPDDETIGAGGYIAQAVRNGAQVEIVLVTDGNKHGLMDRRYREFKSATAILGVPGKNLEFLNFPDGKLKEVNPLDLKRRFEADIHNFDPQIVIYPHPHDQHPDHAVTGGIVEEIMRTDYPDRTGYQYLVHHRRFPQPKELRKDNFLLPPTSMVSFDNEWERFLLSDEAENQKLRAVLQYKSQLRVPFLHDLLVSFVRKNELFAIEGENHA